MQQAFLKVLNLSMNVNMRTITNVIEIGGNLWKHQKFLKVNIDFV